MPAPDPQNPPPRVLLGAGGDDDPAALVAWLLGGRHLDDSTWSRVVLRATTEEVDELLDAVRADANAKALSKETRAWVETLEDWISRWRNPQVEILLTDAEAWLRRYVAGKGVLVAMTIGGVSWDAALTEAKRADPGTPEPGR